MFHQILPKIDLAHMVDKFEKGVFDLGSKRPEAKRSGGGMAECKELQKWAK
jgi:hypothetical protein